MKHWPEFDENGDLPVGIHQATFDSNQVRGEVAIVFDHLIVQNVEGASVFWIRRLAAIEGEQEALRHWQTKRDKTRRGIVEVINDDSA